MSAQPSTPDRTVQPQRFLTPVERSAIIAAVAAGKSKATVAKDFNIHRNTVSQLCKAVREFNHPANPLNEKWIEGARTDAERAITAGLRTPDDPYRAAMIGLKVKEGLGDFAQTQVDHNVNIVVQWGRTDEVQVGNIVDVTPVDKDNTT